MKHQNIILGKSRLEVKNKSLKKKKKKSITHQTLQGPFRLTIPLHRFLDETLKKM